MKFAKEAKEGKFSGTCYYCKKVGHRASECRKKAADEADSAPKTSCSAIRHTDEDDTNDEDNVYTAFGQMWDQEVNENQYGDRHCSVCLTTTSLVEVATLGPIFPQTNTSTNEVPRRPSSTQELLAPSLHVQMF